MGRHMDAIGQQRHGMIKQAARDLDQHEQGRHRGGKLGLIFRAAVTGAQKDMVAGPGAMVMLGGMRIMSVIMRMIVSMSMMVMCVGVVVGHWRSLDICCANVAGAFMTVEKGQPGGGPCI